jgi:AcrR family transcriptional regulator
MSPVGRRPGKTDTRDQILATARRLFSECGYDKTSLRDIATEAQVDTALIRHYFGTKDDLFRTTIGWPFDPQQIAGRIVEGDRDEIGRRLSEVFFEFWEQPDSRASLLAILRGAATHDESATLVRQFIQGKLYQLIASELPGPDAEIGIDLAMAQLLGVAFLRYILQVEPVASTPVAELTDRVAPALKLHLQVPEKSPNHKGHNRRRG